MARPFDPADLSEEYPYRVRVTRAGTPTEGGGEEGQDPGTGLPTDPVDLPPGPGSTELVVFDQPCDSQDAGEQRPRQAAGQPWLQADVTIYVDDEDEATVDEFLDILPNDTFELFYDPTDPDGRTAGGEIAQTRELDTSMLGKYR